MSNGKSFAHFLKATLETSDNLKQTPQNNSQPTNFPESRADLKAKETEPVTVESSQAVVHSQTTDSKSTGIAIVLAILFTLLFIALGFPLLRDWLLALTHHETRTWLFSNKPMVAAWVDWLRIVCEIVLALFVSNQVFNDPLRKWFEGSLNGLRVKLTSTLEKSIEENDARVIVRNALNEMFAFVYLRGNLRQLPDDIVILYKAQRSIERQITLGVWYLFLRLLFLRVLSAFSGKLDATAALMAFLGVLLMKIIKLYLESPVLSRTLLP